jgi:diacylglycerol kinase (ATP)
VDPLLLITSAESSGSDDLAAALEVLHGHTSVEVCETSNPGELDGVLHRAGSRRIVVAGDDKNLHDVIATLHRRNDLTAKTLGLLPLGADQDFARRVGLPLDAVEAAKSIVSAIPRPMDLVVDELGEVVVNQVRVGARAPTRRGEPWKERLGPFGLGVVGRPVSAALATVRPPCVRLHVEVDGEVVTDVDRRVLSVVVGAGPGDGMADVQVCFETTPTARLGTAVDSLRRRRHRHDDTLHLRGGQVSLSGEEFWLNADGAVTGPEGRRTWHVERAAYSLL